MVFVVCMQKKKQTKTVGRRTIKWWRCKDNVAVEYKEGVTVKYESSVKKCVVWRKSETNTKKHLWELQRSYVEEHQERAECQGVVTMDGAEARLQSQYAKRRKPGKKLRSPKERKLTGCKDDTHIRAEEESCKKSC